MNEDELLTYIQRIVLLMVERIEELDLSREDTEKILIRELRDLLDQAGVTVEEALPKIIADSYFGGAEAATVLMAEAGAAAAVVERPFKRQMHRAAIEQILDDALLDFRAALRTAAETGDQTITETLREVRDEFAKGMIGGENRRKITKRVAETFAKKGMTAFTTVDGRRLPLDFYAMTVTRTKTRMATVAGSMARYEEMGQDLVQINENPDSCAICSAHDGLVVSMTGQTEGFPVAGTDVQLPPYHPNCRGTVRPYVASRKDREAIEAAKKRAREFDPNEDRRTPLQRQQYEEEQEKRRIANQEKKTYANWLSIFGDRAPKTIGAFRRMKRQNTPRYQALAAEYNRTIRGGSG